MSTGAASGDWVDGLAGIIGAPGPAVRLLVSILLAYPFAAFHRVFLHAKSPLAQHIFFILAGSYIGYFNYGGSIIHAYICILVNYLVLLVSSGTVFSVVFSFLFQMCYLMTEYYMTETNTYDIKWTIPHCVLTLRLVGQAFDVFDGAKDNKELSKDQQSQALKEVPSLLESAGHVLFPGSFLIGPQYPLKRYLDFVSGKFSEGGLAPPSVGAGIKRLLIGLSYVGIYQVGNIFINNDFFIGPTFAALPLWQKLLCTGIGGRIMLYKYVSVWIVAEGSCTLAGISYNGKESNGAYKWNGCENIDVPLFEKAYKFGHLIASFNKCTNAWVAHNVYKRLKFLNNRHISQFAALLFLAVWHGLHTGYYMCFFLEFVVMNVEKDLEVILPKNQTLARWHASTIGFWIDVIISKILVTIYFGYCILSFSLLSTTRWMKVYGELYYSGHIIFGLWPIYGPFVKKLLVPPREKSEKKLSGQESPKPSTSKAANGLGEKKEM